MMVVTSASDWQSAVGREVTIQVRPVSGRDIEADVRTATAVARGTAGVADVRAYTKEESEQLVEPWLGSGLSLSELPIPRMIVVKLASSPTPDFAGLRAALAARVPSASLDDHRGWIDRMRDMAEAVVVVGIAILTLVVVVTVLSVTFATRGAMATNRPIVEVLHYVGATDGFVAGQFQRHFLLLGFKGGAIGGGIAPALRHPGRGERLAVRQRRGRGSDGLVRHFLDRRRRVFRHYRPDRVDGHGDCADLAPHRQPNARIHQLRRPRQLSRTGRLRSSQ